MFTVRILFDSVDGKFDTQVDTYKEAVELADEIESHLCSEYAEEVSGEIVGGVVIIPNGDGGSSSKPTMIRQETPQMSPMAAPPMSEPEPNFVLKEIGRGYVITCVTPDECDFWGEKLIYFDQSQTTAGVWDDESGGWIVRRRDLREARAFVEVANAGGQRRLKMLAMAAEMVLKEEEDDIWNEYYDQFDDTFDY